MTLHTCDQVFHGTIVHSTVNNPLNVLRNKVLGVNKEGQILFLEDASRLEHLKETFDFTSDGLVVLEQHQFLIPGFIDTHIHAPQYPYMGTGYDLPLMGWLEKYTFPYEAKYKDKKVAENFYRKVVNRTLDRGTTTASYFATIHYEATTVLADLVEELGQRAYIGKVCMDRNAPDFYVETTQQSLIDTERFIKYVQCKKNHLITPVITPRFAVSCSDKLMHKLGELASKYQLPIQSHLSENTNEISLVEELHPNCCHYTDVYKQHGLLTERSYMAHCCHIIPAEAIMLAECGSGVSHCPASNLNIRSGLADVKFLENNNIKLGLGTDVAGGHSCSMLDAIRCAVTVSNIISMNDKDYQAITHKEAFAMATLGGSRVLGLDTKVGNFEVGKEFDALLIDAAAEDSPFDCFDDDTDSMIQKFLYCGDDRNIRKVYVSGRLVAGKDTKHQH